MKRSLGAVLIVCLGLTICGLSAAEAQSSQILRGEYTQQRTLKGLAKPFHSAGRFVLAGDRGLIWQALSPFAATTILTDAGITQKMANTPPLKISAAQAPFLQNFRHVLRASLSGQFDLLSGQFHVDKTVGDDGIWRAVLTPGDAAALPITRLEITGRSGDVQSILLVRANGDRDLIQLAKHERHGGPLSPDEAALLAASGG